MYVVVSYYGLDNQCIAMQMADVTCDSLTEGDISRLTSRLLCRSLVGRAHDRNRSFPGFSEVTVLGSSCLPGEVWSVEDGSDFMMRSCLALVLIGLGAPIADIVLEVSLSDKLHNLIFKDDAFFRGVADISVKLTVFILIPLRAVPLHRIGSFIHVHVLRG